LDLINDLVELDGQVLGKQASILMGQNEIQIFSFEQRAMGIVGTARGNRKAAIEIFTKFREVSVTPLQKG